jgi:hypothetical protein
MLDNPYETPRVEAFQEAPSSDSELEKRVAALEKLVAESWFLRRHTGYRIAAVWSYFLLGYAIVAAVAMPFVLVFEMIFPLTYDSFVARKGPTCCRKGPPTFPDPTELASVVNRMVC